MNVSKAKYSSLSSGLHFLKDVLNLLVKLDLVYTVNKTVNSLLKYVCLLSVQKDLLRCI